MKALSNLQDADPKLASRAVEILDAQRHSIHVRTDKMFAWLMLLQWMGGIAVAIWISPRSWIGIASEIHIHVWVAVLLGGAICSLPVFLVLTRPGTKGTRFVIAFAQMLFSALLIHLCGGRIETHFHVFGSLALLAAYRDLRVLSIAVLAVTADHALRGLFWPESVYGVMSASFLRSLEHGAWVIFEGVFLAITIRQSQLEMLDISQQRAALESTNELIEAEVQRRTEDLNIAEEELRASVDELKERNQELDEFTYVASHDLQEPVRKLISFSKLLKQDIGCDLNEQAERDLAFIVDAADRMRALIQDLLALSRVGRAALKCEPVSLDECVDRALNSLELRISEADAEIIRAPLPTVKGDMTVLTQLYQNLIGNALKFVSDRKPVIELTAKLDGDRWILGVNDNGIGMKQEYADRVFKPFQRLHGRGEYDGTGIGLAICKKTAVRHGGSIWVESEPGVGCQFKFILKVNQEIKPCDSSIQTKTTELSYC